MIDGAGYLKTFTKIILPQCKSIIASLAILAFIDNWNMVEQPLIFLSDSAKYPLSVYLAYINEGDLGLAFASGVFYMIPTVLIYFTAKNTSWKVFSLPVLSKGEFIWTQKWL